MRFASPAGGAELEQGSVNMGYKGTETSSSSCSLVPGRTEPYSRSRSPTSAFPGSDQSCSCPGLPSSIRPAHLGTLGTGV